MPLWHKEYLEVKKKSSSKAAGTRRTFSLFFLKRGGQTPR
jgi:hypothetical protein